MSARRYLRAGVCTECRPARRAMAERIHRPQAVRRRRWLDSDWPLVVSGVLLVVACVLMGVTI